MNLSNNTILITGGTSGLGRKLAESLSDRDNTVIILGRCQKMLDEMMAKRPAISGFAIDVNDDKALQNFASIIRRQFPRLNVLIANAGISQSEDLTSEHWNANVADQIVMTNIMGVIRVIAAFLQQLKDQPQATIMATSSALAAVPLASFPTYCASKAFIHSWLISMRHQLRNTSVEVLELLPPYLQTALTGNEQLSDPRAMPLDEYVHEILGMIERNDISRGEILLERDYARRWAERDGRYDEIFSMMNPD